MPLPPGTSAIVTAPVGFEGNLVSVNIVYVPGASLVVVTVSGTIITITLGTTGFNTNVDWNGVATAFNAATTLATMVGEIGDFSQITPLVTNLMGGSQSSGLGQFYSAPAPGPPPPVRPGRFCVAQA